MQAIFVQEGDVLDYTPEAAVDAGQVVVVGDHVGIAKLDIEAGRLGALHFSGVFDVVHAADKIGDGVAVYWDENGNPVGGTAGTGAATASADSGNNKLMGFAHGAAAADDATVRIRLSGVGALTSNHYGPLNNLIADPGDAEAIPVTASGRVELVSGAVAETRTLAAPTFGGQELLLGMKTDGGGDIVITVTGCDDGDTVTFGDTGEMVRLIGVAKAAAFVWRVVADPDTIVSSTVG